jgi:hypothetical protein
MSSVDQIKQIFEAPDGTRFDNKADAADYLRKPKVMTALNAITNSSEELNNWIYEHQEFLEEVFASGTIQRVTKSEKKSIEKAFELLATVENLPKPCAFLLENAGAFKDSFRWPAVKRMDPEEKNTLIFKSLMGATENRKDLAEWLIEKKDAIFEAFESGKIKREVSEKALNGLQLYRDKKAAEKLEKEEAAAAEAGLTLEAYRAKLEADKVAKEAAKHAA